MHGLGYPHTCRSSSRVWVEAGVEKEKGVTTDWGQGARATSFQSHVLAENSEDSEYSILKLDFQEVLRIYLSR